MFRAALQEMIELEEAGQGEEPRFGELAADALYAAGELDVMLTSGYPLPLAWAARQRIEIVHARPEAWGCQIAVLVGGRELMTEDREYSYVDIDPTVDCRTPEEWQDELGKAIDPMHGHSPEFVQMIRQAFEQHKPKP
jgi:hypothetical protein